MSEQPLIECVPNFSEGRNEATIKAIAIAIESIPDVELLHVDVGRDANRTVMTFAGPPQGVIDSAFLAIQEAANRIDMSKHIGAHPRVGATDVCPLIPIAHCDIEAIQPFVHQLGKRVGHHLHIPVYLYERSATTTARQNLATIRIGEYEGFAEKMKKLTWKPDYGPTTFNEKAGATIIGARPFLIALNVNLSTKSVAIAQQIAQTIRTSGYVYRTDTGEKIRKPGTCSALKAIGWYMEDYECAQVSMNLVDFHQTSIAEAYEACKTEAAKHGISVNGSELIGMVPLEAMLKTGSYYKKPI